MYRIKQCHKKSNRTKVTILSYNIYNIFGSKDTILSFQLALVLNSVTFVTFFIVVFGKTAKGPIPVLALVKCTVSIFLLKLNSINLRRFYLILETNQNPLSKEGRVDLSFITAQLRVPQVNK